MGEAQGPRSGPAGNPLRATGNWRPTDDLGDSGLVMALARGEVGALAEVYHQHGASVYGVAARLCCPAQAEEVNRMVFLSLWRSPADFDPGGGSLRCFLVAEAHHRAVDVLRADTSRLTPEASTSAHDLEQKVLAGQSKTAVRGLLLGLSKTERQAIILAHFGGYTRGQVATLLSLPSQTVNAAILTGMGRIRANMLDGRQRRPERESGPPG